MCDLQFPLCLASAFSGLSPAGLMTIFYCIKFETPSTWKIRFLYLFPPGTGWTSYTPGTGYPFCRLLRLAGLRWRYSNQPPHGYSLTPLTSPRYIAPARTAEEMSHYCLFVHCQGNSMSTELFCNSGCNVVVCLHSCDLSQCVEQSKGQGVLCCQQYRNTNSAIRYGERKTWLVMNWHTE
jgi:hypothetical protein